MRSEFWAIGYSDSDSNRKDAAQYLISSVKRSMVQDMLVSQIGKRLIKNFRGWVSAHAEGTRFSTEREMLHHLTLTSDYLMSALHAQRKPKSALEACAGKVFSQTDEDGITLEILKRIGISNSSCIEIGCGSGLENNSLILLAMGWNAIWIDGVELAFDPQINPSKLIHSQSFVTRENIYALVEGLSQNLGSDIELITVDIDGNDGYIVQELLERGYRPSVFIVEINEVFPPPIVFKQNYSPNHVWDHTRNFGWSLQAFVNLFSESGYRLVACNPQTGVNAYFVRDDHSRFFEDIPTQVNELYVGRSIHPYKHRDHKLSFDAGTIEHLIRSL
jgi:hypothetical protein